MLSLSLNFHTIPINNLTVCVGVLATVSLTMYTSLKLCGKLEWFASNNFNLLLDNRCVTAFAAEMIPPLLTMYGCYDGFILHTA